MLDTKETSLSVGVAEHSPDKIGARSMNSDQLHIASVVGARPQFVKLAPIHHECVRRGIRHSIIHSGQHYDSNMSDVFFAELEIPNPHVNLLVGSGTHAQQTGQIIQALDVELTKLKSDVVLVYGDTNTTLAAAVVVSKRREFLVHLEAGLRSFNDLMPEEINRILVDHASDLLLAPTSTAMQHLRSEGLSDRAALVGDVMVDSLIFAKERSGANRIEMPIDWKGGSQYVFATLHRAENTDSESRLRFLVERLAQFPIEVRLAVHPRLRDRLTQFGISLGGSIKPFEPLTYFQTVHAVVSSVGVLTDSGGLQKEALILGRPCLTVRDETEWTETVEAGWNILDPDLIEDPHRWFSKERVPLVPSLYGDGNAASRILDVTLDRYRSSQGE